MTLRFSDHAIARISQWSPEPLTRNQAIRKLQKILDESTPAKARKLASGKIILFPKDTLSSGDWTLIHKNGTLLTIFPKDQDVI